MKEGSSFPFKDTSWKLPIPTPYTPYWLVLKSQATVSWTGVREMMPCAQLKIRNSVTAKDGRKMNDFDHQHHYTSPHF